MLRRKFFSIVGLLLLLPPAYSLPKRPSQTAALLPHAFAQKENEQDRWAKADADIARLPPTAFHELPSRVVLKLVSLTCTIPQARGISARHNVIKGRFQRPQQTDWAVLCSRKRTSSILIFWKGSANSFSEIAAAPDSAFLQTTDGDGTIGFSRMISPVETGYILEHYREYHGSRPPPINHQGIDDGFLEKASTIHYYYGRKWRELQGAD